MSETVFSGAKNLVDLAKVGIYNTDPTEALHIGNGSTQQYRDAKILFINPNAYSSGGTATTPQTVIRLGWKEQVQDLGTGEGCAITFSESLLGDSVYYDACRVASFLETGTGDTNRASALTFWTSVDGGVTAAAERMRITSTGNVGIGTTNPTGLSSSGTLLHVCDATSTNPTIRIDSSGSTGQARLHLSAGGGANYRASRIDFFNFPTSATVPTFTLINDFDQNGTNNLDFVNSAGTRMMALKQNGNVGIGTTSPGATFHIDRTSASGDAMWIFQRDGAGYTSIRYDTPTTSFYAGTGGATASVNWRDRYCIFNPSNAGVYLTYGGLAWGNTSDLRAKNILGEISNAVAKVDTLRSIFYTLKDDDTNTRRVGLVAQEVVEVLPEAVDIPTADDGLYGIRYTELIPLALAAIKELSAKNTALEARLAAAGL